MNKDDLFTQSESLAERELGSEPRAHGKKQTGAAVGVTAEAGGVDPPERCQLTSERKAEMNARHRAERVTRRAKPHALPLVGDR